VANIKNLTFKRSVDFNTYDVLANSKILFLGPTRPLIDQYYETFKSYFEIDEKEMAIFTGFVSPEKRAQLWKDAKIIFSTPQGLENDIISGRINLENVSLLGIDEAHKAVGDYAYVFVAKQYNKKSRFPRILALTASPGSDLEKIQEVCKNLFIEEIEIRTDKDPDVRQYVYEINIDWVEVELPKIFVEAKKYFKDFLQYIDMAEERFWGIIDTFRPSHHWEKVHGEWKLKQHLIWEDCFRLQTASSAIFFRIEQLWIVMRAV